MKRPALTLCLLLLSASSLYSQAKQQRDNEKSCNRFVQSFFDWYVEQPDVARALKNKPAAFSPELARRLKEDVDSRTTSSGKIEALDWDPILTGNDRPPGERYLVSRSTVKPDGECRAELRQVWSGEETDNIVAAELSKDIRGWHFVNFYYRFQHSDFQASVAQGGLLGILRQMRITRAKSATRPKS